MYIRYDGWVVNSGIFGWLFSQTRYDGWLILAFLVGFLAKLAMMGV